MKYPDGVTHVMCSKVQGDTLEFDPYRARYWDSVATRGLFYWNPHTIPDKKH